MSTEQQVLQSLNSLIEEQRKIYDKVSSYLIDLSEKHTIEFPNGVILALGQNAYITVYKISNGLLHAYDWQSHDDRLINISTLNTSLLESVILSIKVRVNVKLHPEESTRTCDPEQTPININ